MPPYEVRRAAARAGTAAFGLEAPLSRGIIFRFLLRGRGHPARAVRGEIPSVGSIVRSEEDAE